MTTAALKLLDALAAEARTAVTTGEVRSRLSLSPQGASNLLSRLERDGLVERVRRGEYLIHPLGELGLSAASADRLDEAVAIAANGRVHRICYRSALHEHGLLSRPGRRIQLAVDRRLRIAAIGERELEAIIERVDHIHIGAENFGQSWISTKARALLEAAQQPRRVGGIAAVAEALWTSDTKAADVTSLAIELNLGLGQRRLASLNEQLGLGRLDDLTPSTADHRPAPLDPDDTRTDGFLDRRWNIRWTGLVSELQAVVRQ